MARAMLLTALFLPSCLAALDTSAGSRSGISGPPVFERAWGHGRERDSILAALRSILPTEAKLSLRGLRSRIHPRANRNHPLSQAQENANRQKSRVRARIEHVFGAQQNSSGGRIVRTIGIARALSRLSMDSVSITSFGPPRCPS
jgi:hypothetical protein